MRIQFGGDPAGKPCADRFRSMELQSSAWRKLRQRRLFRGALRHQYARLSAWPENGGAPTKTAGAVARWIGGNGYMSRTRWPAVARPCRPAHHRRHAWRQRTVVRLGRRSQLEPGARPFIQIARIDHPASTLIENVNVFDTNSATATARLSTNANGEIGISYMIGGAPQFP